MGLLDIFKGKRVGPLNAIENAVNISLGYRNHKFDNSTTDFLKQLSIYLSDLITLIHDINSLEVTPEQKGHVVGSINVTNRIRELNGEINLKLNHLLNRGDATNVAERIKNVEIRYHAAVSELKKFIERNKSQLGNESERFARAADRCATLARYSL